MKTLKKIKKVSCYLFLLTMLVTLLTFGCSRADYSKADYEDGMALYGSSASVTSSRMRQAAMPVAEAASITYNEAAVIHDTIRYEESSDTLAANVNNSERKLVRQAYVRIRVENLTEADAAISNLMTKYGAYAASTNVDEHSYYYSLRVPAPQYDVFLSEMSGMGRLINRSENTEDVTLRYYDLEGRLEMKRTLLRTFQSYLVRARTIEEILSVEARIAELQNDIEGTGVQLRHLANRVDYATIDLSLLGPVSASQAKNETLGERVKKLFGSFGDFLSTTLIVIIGIVIFGIPLVLLFTFLFWLLFGKIGLLRKLWGLVREKK